MPGTGSPVESQLGWSYRYGLPLWMRSNLDRLNVSTDFEEYACSPPETDSGFIPEFETKFSANLFGENKLSSNNSGLKNSKSSPTLCELQLSAQHHELCKALKEATRQSFLANSAVLVVPHVLGCHSSSTSTDTTPSSTPQGSPLNSRKSLSSSNSKQWFCSGALSEKKPQPMTVVHENPDCAAPITTVKKAHPQKKAASRGYRKFMVSNFDLNAVSPTSW